MKFSILAGAGALAAALLAAATAANAQPRTSITLFQGPNYTGRSVTLYADVSNLTGVNFNDQAMSARVRGGVWKLCEDKDYRSRCETLDRDIPNLDMLQFNRRASSVRLVSFGDMGPGPRPPGPGPGPGPGYDPRPPGPGPGWQGPGRGPARLVLFEFPNFQGRRVEVYDNNSNLTSIGFNDRAMSARAFGGWTVCEDKDYRSRCERIDGDIPDLDSFRMSQRISSVRRGY